ncbi:alpha-amylase family glycosyl hydrolase [Alteromonas lipolytica]|uniref:Alpha-amlyase n=1 Tax=Alteromonas lipolytica TaxID=1856405 RepID=A0A1E8FFJ8_9ALTE|nr:alpha-amylase family glycosyl hydrolase [Alteromonas lipolytica]OFI34704.1 alpha-amlyase [Alteromonas lipolytica]GGF53306.1 alpha-amlyase [Alteromonas lipolytica]
MSLKPVELYSLSQPDWSKDAVIYQVNTRQFSQQGNFDGVTDKLEAIVELGATILWLMPVHPIGVKNRKGELGSPYAVKDYLAINPEFGDASGFQHLVDKAHALGLKVILDWVPNHSAWDNSLVTTHPEWYARDHKGDFRPSPWWDWSDIIEFDYDQPGLREYMINAMSYWVTNFDIDGFRCDVAGYVPNDFWQQARSALDKIKPVFLLAEWENRDLHRDGFNMTYAWSWNEALHDIAHGKAPLDRLRKYYSWNERAWPHSAYRMTFVSNHDKNAWDGTQREQFGDCLEAAIVLSVLGEGVPLIHNGQEAGESKRLAFFERDPIDWRAHPIGDLYKKLVCLKKNIPALWNGEFGARMIQVPNSAQAQVLSFVRMQNEIKVVVALNFSAQSVVVDFYENLFPGEYLDVFAETDSLVTLGQRLVMPPWSFRVFVSANFPLF